VWVVDASGIRQLPDRCLDPNAPATTAAIVAASTEQQPCDPPTYVDAQGIRRVHPECLASPTPPASSSAATPPAAPTSAEDQRCDPPWWLDEKGIRRLKMVCLNATDATARAAAGPRTPPAAPATHAAQPPESNACDPPWYVDSRGIQRLQQDCL
jgi:hypothetical protein